MVLKGRADSLLLAGLTESSAAVDSKRSETLRTHREVESCLFSPYDTHEVIAEAYKNFVDFRQCSAKTEGTCYQMLWNKALRCETVFSDRGLKSVFIDELVSETRARGIRHFFSLNPRSDYHRAAR